MRDFLIIGANGMQGRIVLRLLLSKGYRVAAADLYTEYLETCRYKKSHFSRHQFNVEKRGELTKLIEKTKPKVVISCIEQHLNMIVYKTCLAQGVHVIDLGNTVAMTRAQMNMSAAFARKGLTAITGCGSTPGVNNVMCQYACDQLDTVESIEAGFAWGANKTEQFVVPFSMTGVLYELSEWAPYIENGEWKKIRPKASEQKRTFKSVGPQSLFLVSHAEPYTFLRNYKSKGVKNIHFYAGFPPHTMAVLRVLMQMGFNAQEELELFTEYIFPTDFLSQMLKRLPFPKGYKEDEELWVKVSGIKNGAKKHIMMQCMVHSLPGWEKAGSNVDTGIPAALIGEMILTAQITKRGSFAPEQIVPQKLLFKKLAGYRMSVRQNGKRIN